MSISSLISRLTVGVVKQTVSGQSCRGIALNGPLFIHPTQCLYKEPLKKKRKQDPAQLRAKEERKKRKIEKEIKRLQRFTQTLKPIEEMQLPLQVQDQRELRERPQPVISPEEEERRVLLLKKWSVYRRNQYMADLQMLDRVQYSQQLALDKLREESEELYQAAISVDEALIPIIIKGPTLTPPVKDYESPDGEYTNSSFKWE